jgi:hypothetical protein
VDIETTVIQVLGGWLVGASSGVGPRVLGPTLDVMGEQVKEIYLGHVERWRTDNTLKMIRKAQAKKGKETWSVHPRVLAKVIEGSSWCEGPVVSEYFAGILAASEMSDVEVDDDRGLTFADLASRISTHDLYLHYLIHDALRRQFANRPDLNLGEAAVRRASEMYFPAAETLTALGRNETGFSGFEKYVMPALTTLVREDLIERNVIYGDMRPQLLEARKIDYAPPGFLATPSIRGVQLFMWGHGQPDIPMHRFLSADVEFVPTVDLGFIEGVRTIQSMQAERAEREKSGKPPPMPPGMGFGISIGSVFFGTAPAPPGTSSD